MKNFTLLIQGLLIFGLILFSVGCEDDPASIIDLPQIEVSTVSLDFGSSEVTKTFTISNSGLGTLNWALTDDADWLMANPSSGSNLTDETNTITLTVNRAGLDAGSYTAEVTLTDTDHDLEGTVNVTMTVDAPTLSISMDAIDFGTDDTTATFSIANLGAGTITWSIAVDMGWLAVTPTSGTTTIGADDIVTVNVDRSMASPGVNSGMITISSDVGDEMIDVMLTSGTMIWSYNVTDQANFVDGWEAWDDEAGSGDDFWGVAMNAGRNDSHAVWCAAQGDMTDQYDNEMVASMVIWPQNAINIANYSNVSISFWMKYETEDNNETDMFALYVLGTDDAPHSIDASRFTGSDFEWKQYTFTLTDFPESPSANLQLWLRFVSDASGTARGVYIQDMEVWGDAN